MGMNGLSFWPPVDFDRARQYKFRAKIEVAQKCVLGDLPAVATREWVRLEHTPSPDPDVVCGRRTGHRKSCRRDALYACSEKKKNVAVHPHITRARLFVKRLRRRDGAHPVGEKVPVFPPGGRKINYTRTRGSRSSSLSNLLGRECVGPTVDNAPSALDLQLVKILYAC